MRTWPTEPRDVLWCVVSVGVWLRVGAYRRARGGWLSAHPVRARLGQHAGRQLGPRPALRGIHVNLL